MNKTSDIALRLAEPGDAPLLGRAALAAGGGLYEHLLAKAAARLDPATVLASAIAAGVGCLSWRNGFVAENTTGPIGAVIAYDAVDFGLDTTIATAATSQALADLAPLFEAKPAPETFYLHAIWTTPEARGCGAGALLLDAVTAMAADAGHSGTSLHVWADNVRALRLYQSRGFETVGQIDIPRRKHMPHDGGKLLMQT